MQIYVEIPKSQTRTLEVDPQDTIEQVKREIREKELIPTCTQRLTFREKQLDDDDILYHCGIQEGSTLYLRVFVRK